ncbi:MULTISPECIES: hypothetical protein [unclassified Pseudomonas]|uniref:hypothetical protein n=1 Tax=unclassified Pseudomonas TaxID=196821 RepID=UPI0025F4A72F|nr:MULTISPECIES: hypothetical protein [unclassified Pseudomonas]
MSAISIQNGIDYVRYFDSERNRLRPLFRFRMEAITSAISILAAGRRSKLARDLPGTGSKSIQLDSR